MIKAFNKLQQSHKIMNKSEKIHKDYQNYFFYK